MYYVNCKYTCHTFEQKAEECSKVYSVIHGVVRSCYLFAISECCWLFVGYAPSLCILVLFTNIQYV